MLILSGLGLETKTGSTTTTTTTSPKTFSLRLSPELTKTITKDVIDTTKTDLYKQLQCLLNAAMMTPIVQAKFVQWQNTDVEGWNLVQRWSPLAVDGVIKTADSWIPRRESDTYALLSRTGIQQFWIGDPSFGPSWVAANAASLVKTLADFVGPGIAGPCDFVALRAAATQAAADQAAADAAAAAEAAAIAQAAEDAAAARAAAEAAAKAAEEAAILQHQADVQQDLQAEIAAADQQTPAGDTAPGMMVEPTTEPAAEPGTEPAPLAPRRKRWVKWALIGGAAFGVGLLVANARR